MPLTRVLDPRFGLCMAVALDEAEAPEFRAACRRGAEDIAVECGFSLTEACAASGVVLPADPPPPASVHQMDEVGERVAAALLADQERSDRAIARAAKASPTFVGRMRASMGLERETRTAVRRGKPYPMAATKKRRTA